MTYKNAPHYHYARTLTLFLLCTMMIPLLSIKSAPTAHAQTCDPYVSPHLRIGINVDQNDGQSIGDYPYEQLYAGWYHNYGYRFKPNAPTDIDFLPMFRGDNTSNLENRLGPTIDANPGEIWFAGNEPDRIGQDGILPDEYAEFYHEAYTFIKGRDPSAQIAFGGIVQPTPVRLEYLDRVVAAYNQKYGTNPPADIIHTHAFVMNEISWGAGMPPGNNYTATPRNIEPSEQWSLPLFKEQMVDMRQWMKDNGYRQKPLIVSEYGLLLPDVFYDFTDPAAGEAGSVNFLTSTFDYFINETNADLGYSADGNRLVQQFAWFSLNYPKFDFATQQGLNGGLFYRDTDELTALGQAFADYSQNLIVETVDLNVSNLQVLASSPISASINPTVTISIDLLNTGGVVAEDTVVTFWNGDPQAGGTQIGSSTLDVLPACQDSYPVTFDWGIGALPTGTYDLFVTAQAGNSNLETNAADNGANTTVEIVMAPIQPTPATTEIPPTEVPPTEVPPTEVPPTEVPAETPTPDPLETPTSEPTAAQPTDVPAQTPTEVPAETPVGTATPGPTAMPTSGSTTAPGETVTPAPSATDDPAATATPAPSTMPTSDPAETGTPTAEPSVEATAVPATAVSGTPVSETPVSGTPVSETPVPDGTPTSVSIVPPVPTGENDGPELVPTVPARLYLATDASPETVTSDERLVVYEITYQNQIASNDVLDDVTLQAEIPPNTRFVAEKSDSRWVCPEPSKPGDICELEIGTLNARDLATVLFAVEFIYPTADEFVSFETNVAIVVGDEAEPRVNDKTTVTVTAQESGERTLYIPLIEVGR